MNASASAPSVEVDRIVATFSNVANENGLVDAERMPTCIDLLEMDSYNTQYPAYIQTVTQN